MCKLPRCSSAWAKVHVFPVLEPISLPGFPLEGVHPSALPLVPRLPVQGQRWCWGVRGDGRNSRLWEAADEGWEGGETAREEPADLAWRRGLLGSAVLQEWVLGSAEAALLGGAILLSS